MAKRQTAFERDFHNLHGDDDLEGVETGPGAYSAKPSARPRFRSVNPQRARPVKMSGAEMTVRLSVGLAGLIVAIMLGVCLLGFAVLVLSMIWTAISGG